MVGIRKFEEIRAWQKARELVNQIYRITEAGKFAKDFGLRDQIRRAAGSVMHNIAEGFDSGTDLEFKRFLIYSMRSVTETQSQLYTALDQFYINKEQFDVLYSKAEKIKNDLRKFISYLQESSGQAIKDEVGPYLATAPENEQMLNAEEDLGLRTSDISGEGEP